MTNNGVKRPPAYELKGVTKSYGDVRALAPVSLTIEAGERVAIVGPSGSGKTTLMHLMGGVIRPDGGSIKIHGKDLAGLNPGRELAGLVGIVHQQFDLVPQLSVVHNVLAGRLGNWGLAYSLWSLISPRQRQTAIRALARVGIADKANERTIKLSGGEQQRVAVARLLLQDPLVILADEPVASLDPERSNELLKLLSSSAIEQGKTLIASLHIVEMVKRHFPRVIGLRDGELHFDLPAEKITEEDLDRLYSVADTSA